MKRFPPRDELGCGRSMSSSCSPSSGSPYKPPAAGLKQNQTRRGYSLIELLLVIMFSTVATGGSVVCISTMLKAERLTAVTVQESQAVARLRSVWKEDVHLAQEWNVGAAEQNGDSQCDLSLQDHRTVRYRSSAAGLSRQVLRNDSVEENAVFQFAEGTRFQFDRVEQPRLARLRVIRPAMDSSGMAGGESSSKVQGRLVMTFDAALGREAKFLEYFPAPQEEK
jgi:hypothetical protein